MSYRTALDESDIQILKTYVSFRLPRPPTCSSTRPLVSLIGLSTRSGAALQGFELTQRDKDHIRSR